MRAYTAHLINQNTLEFYIMFSFKSLFKVAALLTAVMIASCSDGGGGSSGNDLSGDGSNGGQSNPPVLTVPSNVFVFPLGVASINTIAGSGGTPASCSVADLPAGLTAHSRR